MTTALLYNKGTKCKRKHIIKSTGHLHAIFQDVGLQAVITEFLIRCSSMVFAPSIPSVLNSQVNPSHCIHCCCHCDIPKQQDAIKDVPPGNHSVTFAKNTSQTTQLKPVLKNSESNTKKVELRVNNNPNRPRPRSVAVPNPATAGHYQLEEVKLVSLPARQTAELVDVPVNSIPTQAKSDSNGNVKPSVTFHTVLDTLHFVPIKVLAISHISEHFLK